MGNSKPASSINNITQRFFRHLNTHIQPGDHLAVALSGGVDSVVLLHLLIEFSKSIPINLSAVHVDHGISTHSYQWSMFCQTLCDKVAVPLSIHRLNINKQPQQSLEAVARKARYQIFKQIQADYILLAQHQDDQVETLMLQLLRGAGVKGLSVMPIIRSLESGKATKLFRPLLDTPRSDIVEYAQLHNLSWVTDESNLDTTYDRNFLRHDILPRLETRYPAYRKTLFRSTQHLGEANYLLDELARIDAEHTIISGKISLQKLRQLDSIRAKNLLRYLLTQHKIRLPNATTLEEILRQLYTIPIDNHFRFTVDTLDIRYHRGLIEFLPADHSLSPQNEVAPIIWQGESSLIIPVLQGTLRFVQQDNIGIDTIKLAQQTVTIRIRSGGERFQPDCGRPRRSLKKILQEAGVPAWERYSLPLLFCGEQLVWVAGIGIDCHFQASAGQTGLVVTWHTPSTVTIDQYAES